MGGLVCPKCGHEKSDVVDCRPFAAGFRRRRECQLCGHRWTTYECDSAVMRRLMDRAQMMGASGKEKEI